MYFGGPADFRVERVAGRARYQEDFVGREPTEVLRNPTPAPSRYEGHREEELGEGTVGLPAGSRERDPSLVLLAWWWYRSLRRGDAHRRAASYP